MLGDLPGITQALQSKENEHEVADFIHDKVQDEVREAK